MVYSGALPDQYFYDIDISDHEFKDVLDLFSLYVKYCSIIVDDAGGLFDFNLQKKERKFLFTPKNNNCDIIIQFHDLSRTPAVILANLDVLVLKETQDGELPNKVHETKLARIVLEEIKKINRTNGNRFAHYYINYKENTVFNPNEKNGKEIKIYDFLEAHKNKQNYSKLVAQTRGNYRRRN